MTESANLPSGERTRRRLLLVQVHIIADRQVVTMSVAIFYPSVPDYSWTAEKHVDDRLRTVSTQYALCAGVARSMLSFAKASNKIWPLRFLLQLPYTVAYVLKFRQRHSAGQLDGYPVDHHPREILGRPSWRSIAPAVEHSIHLGNHKPFIRG